MPTTKSAKKELRKSSRRANFNANRKKEIKDTIKKIHKAIEAQGLEEAQKLAKSVVAMLDKAAKNSIIHKNAASRKKSRLLKAITARKNQPKQ